MKLLTVMCCVAAIAFGLLGCGGGGSSSSESGLPTSTLSKAAYVKKVTGICSHRTSERIGAMRVAGRQIRSGGNEPAVTTVAGVLQKIWPSSLHAQAQQIRMVGAPAGGAPKIEKYLAALEKSAKEIEIKKPDELFALQKLLVPVDVYAAAYGLETCQF